MRVPHLGPPTLVEALGDDRNQSQRNKKEEPGSQPSGGTSVPYAKAPLLVPASVQNAVDFAATEWVLPNSFDQPDIWNW